MKFEGRVVIDAPVEAVWGRLVDLERAGELVPFLVSARLVGEDPIGEGSRAVLVFGRDSQQLEANAEVVEFVPEERLVVAAQVREVRSTVTVSWRVRALDAKRSEVTQTVNLEFGSMMARLGAQALLGSALSDETVEQGLARLKAAVETSK